MAEHIKLGIRGENIAENYLSKKGYRILHRNWRYNHKEIDIVAESKENLLIVEVKTRSTDSFGHPQDAVNNRKIKYLIEATQSYIDTFEIKKEVRFDVLFIYYEKQNIKIEHIEDAFNALL